MIFPLNPSYSGAIVSSGAIADLTTAQQFDIVPGTLVTTTDGKRWQYSAGDKLLEASYILISDETPDWAIIENKPATFTPSAHTHGNLSDTGAIGTTPDLPLKTGTSGVIEAGSFGTTAGTFVEGDDSRLSDARTPTAHASTHAIGGSDAIAPSDIGAQSIFEIESLTLSANVTLTSSRAKTWTVGMFVSSTFDITLPTSGIQVGDILVIKAGTTFNGTAVIKRSATQVTTMGTLLAGRSFRFIATSTADTGWVADGTYTHTHAIADITGLQDALDATVTNVNGVQKIERVTSMPVTPDANTLYIVIP